MGLKIYQHIEYNPRIKFSNYLKDRFQVDQKISALEVSDFKSQRWATASYGGRRRDPRVPGGCWIVGLPIGIGLRSCGGRKMAGPKLAKTGQTLGRACGLQPANRDAPPAMLASLLLGVSFSEGGEVRHGGLWWWRIGHSERARERERERERENGWERESVWVRKREGEI